MVAQMQCLFVGKEAEVNKMEDQKKYNPGLKGWGEII